MYKVIYPKYMMSKITLYVSDFIESVCNVLKSTLWPVLKHPGVL